VELQLEFDLLQIKEEVNKEKNVFLEPQVKGIKYLNT